MGRQASTDNFMMTCGYFWQRRCCWPTDVRALGPAGKADVGDYAPAGRAGTGSREVERQQDELAIGPLIRNGTAKRQSRPDAAKGAGAGAAPCCDAGPQPLLLFIAPIVL